MTLSEILNNDFVKLTVTLLLSLPTAYNRDRATKIMGLRTFPLVAVTTTAFVLIGQTFIESTSSDAQARIIQGILTGIGFIGGGAILKKGDRVLGTASAASIWTMGALGVAVAYNRYDLAVFLALANFAVLYWLTLLKKKDPGGSSN
jgi:putative Mg2+ transporter-C (MgtC) family protein